MRPNTILSPLLFVLAVAATSVLEAPAPLGERAVVLPTVSESKTYILTMSRTISHDAKEKIIKAVQAAGAAIRQEYDYRTFQAVLFEVPVGDDVGTLAWQSTLENLDGFQSVEADQAVSVNAP